jgi:hypothetical protein
MKKHGKPYVFLSCMCPLPFYFPFCLFLFCLFINLFIFFAEELGNKDNENNTTKKKGQVKSLNFASGKRAKKG